MKKFLALLLAVTGLATAPLTRANARQTPASTATVPVAGAATALPTAVHLDETVIIEHRRHYYHHHYYHHRYYHHRYHYRHGVRVYY